MRLHVPDPRPTQRLLTPEFWLLAPLLELLELLVLLQLLLPDAPEGIANPVRSRLPCLNRVRHLNGAHRTVLGRGVDASRSY
jgi:hypothetical protein